MIASLVLDVTFSAVSKREVEQIAHEVDRFVAFVGLDGVNREQQAFIELSRIAPLLIMGDLGAAPE